MDESVFHLTALAFATWLTTSIPLIPAGGAGLQVGSASVPDWWASCMLPHPASVPDAKSLRKYAPVGGSGGVVVGG